MPSHGPHKPLLLVIQVCTSNLTTYHQLHEESVKKEENESYTNAANTFNAPLKGKESSGKADKINIGKHIRNPAIV